MKKELLVNELSIMYDIDKEVAITCIELALSKIIGKEVVSTEDGYAYFNHKKSIFVNVRITQNMLKNIKYFFEKEVIYHRNKFFKEVYYLDRENKIFECKVIMHSYKWFEVIGITNKIKGRLYLDQTLQNSNIRVKDILTLKLKSYIKIKGEYHAIYTQKETYIYTKIVYKYLEKDIIKKIKIDFEQNKMIIKFKNSSDAYTRETRQLILQLTRKLPFKILTK